MDSAFPTPENERILVIDDDPDQVELTALCLERMGYAVRTTTSAREGLELARRESFAVVVTDVDMSELSGIELCASLKHAGSDVPVVVVTGFGNAETTDAARRVGACELLDKPLDPVRLNRSVLRALATRPANAASTEPIRHERPGRESSARRPSRASARPPKG